MWKKAWWPIELLVIICLFAMSLQLILFIGADNYSCFIIGQAINFIGYIAFLIFAVFRINQTSKDTNRSLKYFFKTKFLFKDIWLVLLVYFIGRITYNLIMEIEFVHGFGTRTLSHISILTSYQSWTMISLLALSLPIGVIAEELYFRCYLFEIQHTRFKNYTWIINGFSWSIYHVFTPTNFLALLPTCLIYSYIYQKRRNIWITIAIHLINNIIAFYPTFKFIWQRMST